ELGELGKVDRLDQGAEDRRLGLIVIVGSSRFRGGSRRRRLCWRDRRRGYGGAGGRLRRLNDGLHPRIAITTLTEHDDTPRRRLLLGPQLLDQGRQQRTLRLLGLAAAGEPLRDLQEHLGGR